MTLRELDGSERMLEDLTAVSNEAFATNTMSAIATVEQTRSVIRQPHFRPDGLLLAYRGNRCVGFCRDAVHVRHGEIDILGVAPAARGIGLGRALVRWGAQWLERQGVPQVTLMVDGENENALRLYRSEGFAVERTRGIFSRRLG